MKKRISEKLTKHKIIQKDLNGNFIKEWLKHETLARDRKRTHQYKKNTSTRNILCTKRNDSIQANKYIKKQLDGRILLQRKILQ